MNILYKTLIAATYLTIASGFFSLSSLSAQAGGGSKPHQHGVATLDISFDGLKGEANLDISAEAIFENELAPKTKDERNKETLSLNNLIQNFQEWVKFDGADCEWSDVTAEVDRHKVARTQHADIELEAKVVCKKPLAGTTLKVELQKSYPGIKKIRVQLVGDGLQKGAEITPSNMSVTL